MEGSKENEGGVSRKEERKASNEGYQVSHKGKEEERMQSKERR
jgi:hypothetical protein